MPVLNSSRALADEATLWRRDLHAHPELLFDLPRTAGIVAEKLSAFGCDEVVTGIAQSGVVAVIKGQSDTAGRVVALRSDMDALPIEEAGSPEHRSTVPGRMHACGHDGHTAMLLGAAKHLCENRGFDGTVVLVFQPAEEGGGGGRVMLEEGLLERFGIQEIYGMHNCPGLPVGEFAIRSGPLLAVADRFVVTITGKGGHAASPDKAVDPVLVAAHLAIALQSVVSRNVDPLEPAVLSVTTLKAGDALNVIPNSAEIGGTIRTLSPKVRAFMEKRLREVAAGTAAVFGAQSSIDWRPGYPVTVNDAAKTELAAQAAAEVAGESKVERNFPQTMGAEDFSYMLEKRPGAFIWIGNGDTAELHHPAYDFDDAAIPYGISYWVQLVHTVLAA